MAEEQIYGSGARTKKLADYGPGAATENTLRTTRASDDVDTRLLAALGAAQAGLASYQVVPVVLNADAYDAGDVLFDRTLISANVFPATGTVLFLRKAIIFDLDGQTAAAGELIFQNADVTFGTKDSAPSMSDANAPAIVARVPYASSDWLGLGGFKMCSLSPLEEAVWPAGGLTSLWVSGMTQGTPTQTTGGIVLSLVFGP